MPYRSVRCVLVVLTVVVASLVIASPSQAKVRWTDFFKGSLTQNKWKTYTAPNQARYNGASAKAWFGAGSGTSAVSAYISGGGQTASSGTGYVKIYFPYQTGKFKCKWRYVGGGGKGPMHCRLRYGS